MIYFHQGNILHKRFQLLLPALYLVLTVIVASCVSVNDSGSPGFENDAFSKHFTCDASTPGVIQPVYRWKGNGHTIIPTEKFTYIPRGIFKTPG